MSVPAYLARDDREALLSSTDPEVPNIQRTSREYSGNIKGIFRKHSGRRCCLATTARYRTFREHQGDSQGTFSWRPPAYLARDDREALLSNTNPAVRNIQGTFREHSVNIQ
jgi:hypothetical protein